MFPPLQKTTPRTSSSHENFRTAASGQLLRDEQHFSPAKPLPPPVITHHFGKANSESARRTRNTNAIRVQQQQQHQQVLAASAALDPRKAVDVHSLQKALAALNSNGGEASTSKIASTPPMYKLAKQLSPQELEQFVASTTTTASGYKNASGRGGASRYGLHFTAPSAAPAASGSDCSTTVVDHATLLLTDEMMDKLYARDLQRRTKRDLDAAASLRRRQIEARKLESQRELALERQRADELAHGEAAERGQHERRAQRQQQRQLADELRAAERRRLERDEQERRAQQRFAALAKTENDRSIVEEQLAAAVQRHRKEETARANLLMAGSKKQRRMDDAINERSLEQKLLAEASVLPSSSLAKK